MRVDPELTNHAAFTRRMQSLGYVLSETLIRAARQNIDAGSPPYRGRLLHYRRRLTA